MTLEAKLGDEISYFANKNRVYLKGCKRLTYYSTCLFMRYLVLHINFIGSALIKRISTPHDRPSSQVYDCLITLSPITICRIVSVTVPGRSDPA
jgi:hypothetical protein